MKERESSLISCKLLFVIHMGLGFIDPLVITKDRYLQKRIKERCSKILGKHSILWMVIWWDSLCLHWISVRGVDCYCRRKYSSSAARFYLVCERLNVEIVQNIIESMFSVHTLHSHTYNELQIYFVMVQDGLIWHFHWKKTWNKCSIWFTSPLCCGSSSRY